MDWYAALTGFAKWLGGYQLLLVPVFFSVLLYVFAGKRQEFSWHAIQNSAASVLVFVLNVAAGIIFVRDINAGAQDLYASLNIPQLPADVWTGPWLIVGFVLAIMIKDLCDYWLHRALHTRWGWPAHAAHHTDTHVNGFTAFRVHAIEPMLMMLNYLVIMTWLQLPQLIPIVTILILIHNIYVHLDLDWDHGPFKYLLASPRFHRWHHADREEVQGKNLANLIPLYDKLFGTYYDGGRCDVPMGALSSGLNDKNPILIWIYPFQTWGKMIWRRIRRLARRLAPQPRADLPPAE